MNKLFTLAGVSRLAAAAAVAVTMSAPVFAQSTTPAEPAPAATEAPAAPAADTAAAPAAEAAAPAAEAAPEATTNPYGLKAIIDHGDLVAKSTLVLMLIMSAGTWYIFVTKLIEQSKLMSQATFAEKNFWTASSVTEGASRLKENSAFRGVVEDGLRATEHHDGALTDHIDLHEWVTMSLQRSVDAVNARLQGGLSFLASVGSTSPFIGLFGTVWGILNALVAIGLSGQASIDKVAGPVGEALIMTAIGLAVAVPAVLAYNWLTRRNKLVMDRLRNFSADLHALLIAGQKAKSGRSA
ncbi:MotA/TolQ/ExbB proton channel family protein [Niveispirillum cyanobacteriorum]|uniref:Biopolymer transport protein ExbB n=1 Tax=Niveispirillum cyanobacteriorum TaxID=1612173 RepID=A0A2K9NCS6_9PROT|nr:MotA/TolQ/ExbB proton channel family protein [Niveispirillum cyanobacteriorum]AUN29985.1 biopolymer transporter ExbB [Niveispirillum cyanobacteriorum]GGE58886.1 biopolymer transporter ExbB [Niveispirillum cyanobacteriorum]